MSPPVRLTDDDFGSHLGAVLRAKRPSPPPDLERSALAALRPAVAPQKRRDGWPLALACAVAGGAMVVLYGPGPAEDEPPPMSAVGAAPSDDSRGPAPSETPYDPTPRDSATVGGAGGNSDGDGEGRRITPQQKRQLESLKREAKRARQRAQKAYRDAALASEREQALRSQVEALEAKQRKAPVTDPIARWVECGGDPLCGIPDDPSKPPQLEWTDPEPDSKPFPPLTLKEAGAQTLPSHPDSADLRRQLVNQTPRIERCGRYGDLEGLVHLRFEVAASGEVRLVSGPTKTSGLGGSTSFVGCVNGALSRIQLAPSAKGAIVRYPIHFPRLP